MVKVALSDENKSFDLPKDERWLSDVYQKTGTYSPRLKRGVSDTMALLASRLDGEGIQAELNGIASEVLNRTANPEKVFYNL